MTAGRALARRAVADARGRLIGFALLFGLAAALQAVAYGSTYPTRADRLALARTIGETSAIRLLYGVPHDLLTVGGYLAWRIGGSLAIVAAVFGLLAATRALRAEEESGRAELVLAAVVSRRTVLGAALGGIAAQLAILFAATFAGLLPAGADVVQTAYLALAVVAPAAVFAGVGALTAQLAPTRRGATMLGAGGLAVALVLRMVADVAPGAGWLRWLTPLGWAEELRPFTGARPLALVPLVAATVLLVALAARIAVTRDVGEGLLPARDSAAPRTALLGSTTGLAIRLQRAGFAAWLAGIAVFALVLGGVAHAVAGAVSGSLSRELAKLGTQSPGTATGFIGFVFEFFVLAVALFACYALAALRDEEASLQLETLLAQPVSRVRWLASRLALVAAGCAVLALAAALLTWVAAVSQGADLSFGRMVEAGLNCLPAALLYLALGGLAFAVIPRATAAVAYGIVALTFLLEVLGALANVPGWVRGISPFHHVGLVPAAPFDTAGAIGMLVIAALAAAAAVWRFRGRDIVAA